MARVRIPEHLCYVWIKNGAFGFGIKLYPNQPNGYFRFVMRWRAHVEAEGEKRYEYPSDLFLSTLSIEVCKRTVSYDEVSCHGNWKTQ
jgi:hypothetical protein